MNIILKHNFIHNQSQNPHVLLLCDIKNNLDFKLSFKQFLYDLFHDLDFYGKNTLSNRTSQVPNKHIFTILNVKHYHLGDNNTINPDLLYVNNGNPIPRKFTDLYPTVYTNNYKTSNLLINYCIDNGDVVIYNVTKHHSWEDIKNQFIQQNNGIAYFICNNCQHLTSQCNCTCTQSIHMHVYDVVTCSDTAHISTNVANNNRQIINNQTTLTPKSDIHIDSVQTLNDFLTNYIN